MKNGRLQCKDIDDLLMLRIIRESQERNRIEWRVDHLPFSEPYWVLAPKLGLPVPEEDACRLFLAKARSLISRRLLDGCTCGCRGDFELTDKGHELLSGASS